MIKRLNVFVLTVLATLWLPMITFAQDANGHQYSDEEIEAMEKSGIDVESEINKQSDPDAEAAIQQLLAQWSKNGYPDNVGHVMMDSEGKINVGLVDNTESAQNEIKSMVDTPEALHFNTAKYAYNDLLAVHEKISDQLVEQSSDVDGVYGVGLGITTIDGEVTGFGESGNEFRVTVIVDESYYEKYVEKFQTEYGDRVYVEASDGPIALDESEGDDTNESAMPANEGGSTGHSQDIIWVSMIAVTVLVCLALTVYLFRQNQFIAIKQTTSGVNISRAKPINRKKVISAIKQSDIEPSDRVYQTLMKEITNKLDDE